MAHLKRQPCEIIKGWFGWSIENVVAPKDFEAAFFVEAGPHVTPSSHGSRSVRRVG